MLDLCAGVLRRRPPLIVQSLPFVPCARYASCIVHRNMECLRLSRSAVSSFGNRDAFLHSPPMVESSAQSIRLRHFFLLRRIIDRVIS
jgi:hypothetical protein